MKSFRNVDNSGAVTKIIYYNVPDVGDKVVDKEGNEGYCTGVNEILGTVYEISESWTDPNCAKATVKESIFKEGILKVKTNESLLR